MTVRAAPSVRPNSYVAGDLEAKRNELALAGVHLLAERVEKRAVPRVADLQPSPYAPELVDDLCWSEGSENSFGFSAACCAWKATPST